MSLIYRTKVFTIPCFLPLSARAARRRPKTSSGEWARPAAVRSHADTVCPHKLPAGVSALGAGKYRDGQLPKRHLLVSWILVSGFLSGQMLWMGIS